jgi:hypothetical protein
MRKYFKIFLLAICLVSFIISSETKKIKTQTKQRNPYPYLRAIDTGRGCTIVFYNSRVFTVRIYWVNYRGTLLFYRNLPPGQSYAQASYARHPWVFLTSNNVAVGYYISSEALNQIHDI